MGMDMDRMDHNIDDVDDRAGDDNDYGDGDGDGITCIC